MLHRKSLMDMENVDFFPHIFNANLSSFFAVSSSSSISSPKDKCVDILAVLEQ